MSGGAWQVGGIVEDWSLRTCAGWAWRTDSLGGCSTRKGDMERTRHGDRDVLVVSATDESLMQLPLNVEGRHAFASSQLWLVRPVYMLQPSNTEVREASA